MTNTAPWLNPGEQVIKEGQTMYYIDKIRAFPARMVLTNERLRVESQGNPFLGLLKLLFKKHQSSVVIDAPPAQCNITVEKFLRAERIVVTLPTGEVRRVLIDPTWRTVLNLPASA